MRQSHTGRIYLLFTWSNLFSRAITLCCAAKEEEEEEEAHRTSWLANSGGDGHHDYNVERK